MTKQTVSKFPAVLLFGAPGVGKGTQGQILDAIPGFFHLASGEAFRALPPESDESREAATYSSRGSLVPDKLTIKIFRRALLDKINEGVYHPDTEVLVLDGIPRTVRQADSLKELVDVLAIISFGYSDENVMVDRIKGRGTQQDRSDDMDETTIRHRFEVYRTKTEPVLKCFSESVIHKIDAIQKPSEVLRDVLNCVIPVCP